MHEAGNIVFSNTYIRYELHMEKPQALRCTPAKIIGITTGAIRSRNTYWTMYAEEAMSEDGEEEREGWGERVTNDSPSSE